MSGPSQLEDPSKPEMGWQVIAFVVLSMAILFGFQLIFSPPEPPPQSEVAGGIEEPAGGREQDPVSAETQDSQVSSVPSESAVALEDTQGSRQEIVLENDSVRLEWSSLRSGLRSVQLLAYEDSEGNPLELIPQETDDSVVRPMEVLLGVGVYDELLRDAVYEVEGPSTLSSGRRLEMRFRKGSLNIERAIVLPSFGNVIQVQTSVEVDGRSSPYRLTLGAGIGPENEEPGVWGDFASRRIVYKTNQGLTSVSGGDLEDRPSRMVSADWVAVDSHFFSYVLLGPGQIDGLHMGTDAAQLNLPDGTVFDGSLIRADVEVAPSAEVDLFVGPKYGALLEEVEPSLTQLIDYGYFAVLVRPLVVSLKYVNGFVGNYGFSIIILTFLINVVLFPIRIKQISSMKKMTALQPQLKAIQEKYKKMKRDDPRRLKMNEEVMGLYRSEGVNPLGGCLPLVVQMPFLYAFYRMLASTIELRGAPFALWIEDLSKADPYYITPVVMGVSMIVQQKMMTPPATDPMQKRQQQFMLLMPIFFTFLFLNMSSGLVVYFLFSNVFGVLFQQGYKVLTDKDEPVKHSGKPKGKKKKRN